MSLLNCWEINKCKHWAKALVDNTAQKCIAAAEHLGHSCWAIEGTPCKAKQGPLEEEKTHCCNCKVYRTFKDLKGCSALEFERIYEEERKRYHTLARRWTMMPH